MLIECWLQVYAQWGYWNLLDLEKGEGHRRSTGSGSPGSWLTPAFLKTTPTLQYLNTPTLPRKARLPFWLRGATSAPSNLFSRKAWSAQHPTLYPGGTGSISPAPIMIYSTKNSCIAVCDEFAWPMKKILLHLSFILTLYLGSIIGNAAGLLS